MLIVSRYLKRYQNQYSHNKHDCINSNSIPRQEIMVFIECQIDGI